MRPQHFSDLFTGSDYRVQCELWFLANERYLRSAGLPELAFTSSDQVSSVESNSTGCHSKTRRKQVNQTSGESRLPRARFAEDAQGLTPVEIEADPIEGQFAGMTKLNRKISNLKQRNRHVADGTDLDRPIISYRGVQRRSATLGFGLGILWNAEAISPRLQGLKSVEPPVAQRRGLRLCMCCGLSSLR